MPKNGSPQTSFQESKNNIIPYYLNTCWEMYSLSSFSEGVWGNRSLDAKERFPQKYMNRNNYPFPCVYIWPEVGASAAWL